ncbi:MAG: hypothetical protein AAF570_10630, partial [Bacteroidota bacterium]
MQSENLRDRVLVKVLGKMKNAELKGLEAYLNCTIFNRNPLFPQLLSLIEKRILSTRSRSVGAKALLKGTQIKPERLNKLFTQLFHLTNEYLNLMESRAHPEEQYRFLFQAYARMDVEKPVQNKEFKKAHKFLEKPPLQHENFHLKYRISHQFHLNRIHEERRVVPAHIVENQRLIDQYYVGVRLKYLCATRNMEWIFNLERQPLNEAEIVALYNNPNFSPNPVTTAYFLALQLLSSPDDIWAQLNALNLYLREKAVEIPQMDLRDLWGYALNYCVMQLDRTGEQFRTITDSIYVYLYETGLILEEDRLSAFHFTNITKIRLSLGEFDWVKTFLKAIEGRLINDDEGFAIQYAWALLHFKSRNYAEAISRIKKILIDPPKD